jgi:hypothetical protein
LLGGLAIAIVGVLLQVAAGSTVFKFFEDSIKSILGSIQILGDNNVIGNIEFQALFQSASIVLIVVGLFVACVAFIGCCGSSCNYQIILILYSIILGLIVLGQVIIVILFYTQALNPEMMKQAKKTLEEDYVGIDDSSPTSVVWNVIMLRFECCGVDDVADFDDAKKWIRTRNLILGGVNQEVNLTTPIACCANVGKFPDVVFADDWCAVYPNYNTSNWHTGCWAVVSAELAPYRTESILVISAILVVQAAVLLMTIVIIKLEESSVCPV